MSAASPALGSRRPGQRADLGVRRPYGLWFAAFAGPAAWTAHNLGSTALVPVACAATDVPVLHAVTLLTALVAAAGVVVALRARARTRVGGRRFVAGTAALIDAFFLFVVLVEGVPTLVLGPCLS
jgi:hypothetical protein